MTRGDGRLLKLPALATGAAALLAAAVAASAGLADCRALADERARLACYDALAAAATAPQAPAAPPATPTGPAATGASVAARAVPGTATPPTPTAADLFGRDTDTAAAELGAAAGVIPLRELEATLTDVDRAPDGRLLLTLDNGQAWSQVDTRRAMLHPGDGVRIRRAAFGSYLLSTIDDRRSSLRVRRIR